jgi:Alpha/beta hydrolase domain
MRVVLATLVMVSAVPLALFVTAVAAPAQVTVDGPVAGTPLLNLGKIDLAASGYVTEEFFLSGTATSYKRVGQFTEDGNWQVEHAVTAPFTTRIVVVRPADARKFNGAAVVEWLNVSGGTDLAADWGALHRELVRSGFAYVGVSAQRVGIEGGPSLVPDALPIKKADPARYDRLSHPGDAFSYDIYSQAGMVVRGAAGARVLGPLVAKRVLSTGDSQSAIFLTTYVNAIDPIAKAYDGYLIHSRFGGAASVDGSSLLGGSPTDMPATVKLRADLRVPVITVISETDLIGLPGILAGFSTAGQADTDRLRIWEIPGAAHADTYAFNVADIDTGSTPITQLAAAYAPTNMVPGAKLAKLYNSAPQHHYVVAAALWNLNRWVKDDKAPPKAQRLRTSDGDRPGAPPQLILDANGNAEGGIRTPWVDVPASRLSGLGNSPGPLGALAGVTEPFDQAMLDKLYPAGRAEYLKKFNRSLESATKSGFILRADEGDIKALAAAMYLGSK